MAPSIEEFPYLFQNRHDHPVYCRSHKEAVKRMKDQLLSVRQSFQNFDSDVVRRCQDALDEVVRLGPQGGTVDVVLSERLDLRYRTTLHRRDGIA